MTRLHDGLWRWTAPHPSWTPSAESPTGWPRDVGSLSFEPAGGGIVLVDPLVPADDAPEFWKHLDADVARRGGRVDVVLTNAWHGRSAREIRARYGGDVHVHAHEDAVKDVQADVTSPFGGEVADLPGGLRAHRVAPCDGGETIVELPEGLGLVFGDVLLGWGEGSVRTMPTSWAPEEDRATFQARLREVLRPMLQRPFARLLVSHGEPVLTGAEAAFEEALEAPAKGE